MDGWPLDYTERLNGTVCKLCAEGRPEETHDRIRIYSSSFCDAYLYRRGVQRGFAVVVWRVGHAVEPSELGEADADAFWHDAVKVGRALQNHFGALKMNYQLLGNGTPHLHWLIAPRFAEDIAPGRPLPPSGYFEFPEDVVRRDVAALRAMLQV